MTEILADALLQSTKMEILDLIVKRIELLPKDEHVPSFVINVLTNCIGTIASCAVAQDGVSTEKVINQICDGVRQACYFHIVKKAESENNTDDKTTH